MPLLHRNKRIAIGLEERYARILPPKCDVWFHVASAGEAKLIYHCLQHISFTKKTNLLITTWTQEGKTILADLQKWATVHAPNTTIHIAYFPFDMQETMALFLDAVAPKLVILVETELWYMLLKECASRTIPVCIINGRLSYKTYSYARAIRFMLGAYAPKHILAISKEDAKRFSIIFPTSTVSLMNNIKFEALHYIPQHNTIPMESASIPHILFASIRKKEFPSIATTIALLLKKNSNTALYSIVPRHIHHIQYLEKALQQCSVPYTICTDSNSILTTKMFSLHMNTPTAPQHSSPTQYIQIINIFGIMKQCYQDATVAFVGGSLYKEYGGQNFLEALEQGIVPIIGSYRDNFLWAEEGLQEESLLKIINSNTPEAIAESILNSIYTTEEKDIVGKRFTKWIHNKQHAFTSITELLQRYSLI